MTDNLDIPTSVQRCGCRGKPASNRIAKPAITRARNQLAKTEVSINNDPDAGYFPMTAKLNREVHVVTPDTSSTSRPKNTCGYALSESFLNPQLGNDVERMSDYLVNSYQSVGIDGLCIKKGHTVLVNGLSTPVQFFECFSPIEERLPGFQVANVDSIHPLPTLSPEQQARVAICNAANDCYTTGAYEDVTIRPLVALPQQYSLAESKVNEWYQRAAPNEANLIHPTIIEHDGDDWIFGATVTTTTCKQIARFRSELSPGDEVLIHRPFGGLAAFTSMIETGLIDDRIIRVLLRDSRPVAELLNLYLPNIDEKFDSDAHLKIATDISGPGLRGVLEYLDSFDVSITDFPLLHRELINEVQERWALPDVTVETNGPLLVIGAPNVIRSFKKDVSTLPIANPKIIGQLTVGSGQLVVEDGLNLERYIEGIYREDY